MSDAFYDIVVLVGRLPFWSSSSPVILGAEHTRRRGAFILASNHQAPYDVPLLMRHAKRRVDFVSITEVFEKPAVAWFYGSMNAFPLDRSRPDARTVRLVLDRLARGRVVGMFPEGGFRRGAASVVHTRRIRPGVGRIAQIANVPIVPAVVIGSPAYSRWQSWLPLRRTRYGVIFGEPITVSAEDADGKAAEDALCDAFALLHAKLAGELGMAIEEE